MAAKVVRDGIDPETGTCSLKNTSGGKIVLQRGQKKVSAKKVTHADMNDLRKTLKLSDRGALLHARKLRTIVGRKGVEAGYAEKLVKTAFFVFVAF